METNRRNNNSGYSRQEYNREENMKRSSRERRPRSSEGSIPSGTVQRRPRQSEELHREEQLRRREALRRRRAREIKERQYLLIKIGIMSLLVLLLATGIGFFVYWMLDVDHAAEGALLFEDMAYEEARVEFELAIEEGKDLDEAYLGVALCSWELEEYDVMEASFEAAYLNGAVMTGSARNMLATVALKEKDYTLALTYIQEALLIDGNGSSLTSELLRNEIVCYEELGEWEIAKEKIASYLEAYPYDEDAIREADFLETR